MNSISTKKRKEEKLEKVISGIIKTQKESKLKKHFTPNLFLATTENEILEIMKLRSKVFTQLDYNEEFPEEIEGLNFDDFDENSLVFAYRRKNQITGTMRVILDINQNLQSDEKVCLDSLRKENTLGELSRLAVALEFQKSGVEFKNLFSAAYQIAIKTNINKYILGILEEHKYMYEKFGNVQTLYEGNYGEINLDCTIISWDVQNPSTYFQKIILKNGN